ncbi:MAG: hypothetical protein A2Z96_03570 [Spirochaetes bacterium GWB1_48_6]|nr:MAG: hypothetical protein A2Z96_03570 [Spirochaetes bacterium GWB1_48_6]
MIRVRNRDIALDITQEVFTRTWGYLTKGKRIDAVKPFLYQVAHNTLITTMKKRAPASLDELLEQGIEPVQKESMSTEVRLSFKEAVTQLEQLDEKYRDAVTLRYVEGFSVQEIASMKQESENTISVRIHRGLQQLKSRMA